MQTIPTTINILLRYLIIPTYILPCIFHFWFVILPSVKKSKLQKQEGREEYQSPRQQVDKTPLFLDRKIDEVTAGLDPAYSKRLNSIPVQNTVFIVNYILSMKTEANLSDHYKKDLINLLTTFSKYTKVFQIYHKR